MNTIYQNLKKSQLSQEVVERLRNSIIIGELAPGERLIETYLAEQMGISRVPVREALKILMTEGIIVNNKTRGYEVWTPTKASVNEIVSLRYNLEALAYETSVNYLTEDVYLSLKQKLSSMQNDFKERKYAVVLHQDRLFHEKLIEISGLQRVMSFWKQIVVQWELILHYGTKEEIKFSDEQYAGVHQQILDALYRKDITKASELLYQHIQYTKSQVTKL